jgi:hypothetical protein
MLKQVLPAEPADDFPAPTDVPGATASELLEVSYPTANLRSYFPSAPIRYELEPP